MRSLSFHREYSRRTIIGCCYQAIAQACAFPSLFPGVLSDSGDIMPTDPAGRKDKGAKMPGNRSRSASGRWVVRG